MRINHLLVHLCDTVYQTEEPVSTDPYGRPIYGEIETMDVPCRLDQLTETVVPDDTGQDVIISHTMIFGSSYEPFYNMRISNIRDQKGGTVINGTYRVISIHPAYGMRSLHHYEVKLTREGGSNG